MTEQMKEAAGREAGGRSQGEKKGSANDICLAPSSSWCV